MAPSSPSPTENSDPARSRIRNGWKSAAQKPNLNHSLITKLACEPGRNPYLYGSEETHPLTLIRSHSHYPDPVHSSAAERTPCVLFRQWGRLGLRAA